MNGVMDTKEAIEKIFNAINDLKETATINKNNIEHIQNNIVDIKSDIEEIKSINNDVQIRMGEMEVEVKNNVDVKEFERDKTELKGLMDDFNNHKEAGEKKVYFATGQVIYLVCTFLGIGIAIFLAIIK